MEEAASHFETSLCYEGNGFSAHHSRKVVSVSNSEDTGVALNITTCACTSKTDEIVSEFPQTYMYWSFLLNRSSTVGGYLLKIYMTI